VTVPNSTIELLAPGGDVDAIKAAIVAGADAVYCGLDSFNARNRATNITFDDLYGVVRLAHNRGCKIFITLNIIILEREIPVLFTLLNRLVNTEIDGVIVQDLGLFYLLKRYFKSLDVHASTQMTTHNEGQISFLGRLGVSRVNLSRELDLAEIKQLSTFGHKQNVLNEVFVHGSNCIGFSGLCYISSVHGGNSGNRGRCSQPCRDQYRTTRVGVDYPLNMKDNSAYSDLKGLVDAGVDSLKIEGRIKKFHYVYTVVNSWRRQINGFFEYDKKSHDGSDLYKVFNRGFSNGYLAGDINKNMFIDNPRDNSVNYFTEKKGFSESEVTEDEIQSIKQEIYDLKTEIIREVDEKIKGLSVAKIPLKIRVTGKLNSHLSVAVDTPDASFNVYSDSALVDAESYCIDRKSIQKSLKSLGSAEYRIDSLDLDGFQDDLFIPFKELNRIKNRILTRLAGSRALIDPVERPVIKKRALLKTKPELSLLISAEKELVFYENSSAQIHYQLPECMGGEYQKMVELFSSHKNLLPWFPSILIGDDYTASVRFLEQLRPDRIVTNNTGIASAAYEKGIDWIAGPQLNITNSFTLLCLKEAFNCSGSFVSNEINKIQTKQLASRGNFTLYYSIYHPILLLTSRQCLFYQTTGCEKESMDAACLTDCKRAVSIVNLKGDSFLIDKRRGGYNSMYNSTNFLNTDILTDLPATFSRIFVDLRDIKTKTKIAGDKAELLQAFEDLLAGLPDASQRVKQMIQPSTHQQYKKGL
jgi:U32 family peptidase